MGESFKSIPVERLATDRPEIVYEKNKQNGLEHESVYLKVKGKSLEECRKHFDEIMTEIKKDGSEKL